jgi:hypothetical protein
MRDEQEGVRVKHLDDCRVELFSEMLERWEREGRDVSDLPPPPDGGGLERCAPGCPILQADLDRGHELAVQMGWV